MSSVTDALKSLEDQIGTPAFSGVTFDFEGRSDTDEIRKKIFSWATIKGLVLTPHRTSNETLGKLYGLPQYFNAAMRNQKTSKKTVNLDFDKVEVNGITIDSFSTLPQGTYQVQPQEKEKPNYSIECNKTLIELIVQESIINAFTKYDQQLKTQITKENKNSFDVILNEVSNLLNKRLNNQEESFKKLIEDSLFQNLVKLRSETQKNNFEEDNPEKNKEEENNNSQTNQFIPQIDPNYYFDPYATKVIRAALSMHENLYVYGDTGCGKTTHLEQVCAVLNRGIVRINPHDGITRDMFLGGMKLINNETIFVESALPIAMRNGYVFLVDEISFLPPNLTAILNPIGEKSGKLYIPETAEWITPKPGFCIFATDNTGGKGDRSGQYIGTEVQNTATLDRFAFCLKMDYLPQEKEKEMLEKRFPDFAITQEVEKLLRFATEVRSAFSRGELSLTFSTRKLIKFFDQRSNNFTIEESLSNTILSWLDEDDENLVKSMIDRLDILK